MHRSNEFLNLVLNTVPEHIAVLDEQGHIIYVNRSWTEFGQQNASSIKEAWRGVNYLEACDRAGLSGDVIGQEAASGIRDVITGCKDNYYLEYPCDSPEEQRWFMMSVTHFSVEGRRSIVVSHQDITKRKMAEEKVRRLSLTDTLTSLPNRRRFNEFLENEWRRCARMGSYLSLAIIDIDHFKLLNDAYGHQYGDECLQRFAGTLSACARRPSDLCARYGGEEFAMIMGDSDLEHSTQVFENLSASIGKLNIPNPESSVRPTLTVSAGLVSTRPGLGGNVAEIIEQADALLYKAKANGRNRMISAEV